MQRIALCGDIMLLKNTHIGIVCLSGLILLIGGCATTPSIPETASTPESVYECEAGDAAWDCKVLGSEPSSKPPQARQEANVEPDQERVPWWRVRVRNSDTQRVANANPKRPQTAQQQTRQAKEAAAPSKKRRGFLGIRRRNQAPAPQNVEKTPAPAVAEVQMRDLNGTTPTQTPSSIQRTRVATSVQPTPSQGTAPVTTAVRLVPKTPPNIIAVGTQAVSQRPTVAIAPQTTPVRTAPTSRTSAPTSSSSTRDGLGRDYDFAVQLAAFSNYERSSDFMNAFSSLDLMRVKTATNDKTYYIVIAGTFENKQLANAQSEMLASAYGLSDSYIRTVKSIRTAQVN